MRVAVLRGRILENATADELDGLIQAEAISGALSELGHEPVTVVFSLNLSDVADALRAVQPDLAFNLVESVEAQGRLIHLAPALLDYLRLPYTGARTEAMFLTSNKLLAKRILTAAGVFTPPWLSDDDASRGLETLEGPFIIKSVWEHASIGISESSVVYAESPDVLRRQIELRRDFLGGDCFAELYIEGREFNLSLLASPKGPQVLPPAEIEFVAFPPEALKIVDYKAKWKEESFEYHHTPRSFEFSDEDQPLVGRLTEIARDCWDLFGLRGYARVDFRVDAVGKPWVLEINANPCISPDCGFAAAAAQAGLSYSQAVERIIGDALEPFLAWRSHRTALKQRVRRKTRKPAGAEAQEVCGGAPS